MKRSRLDIAFCICLILSLAATAAVLVVDATGLSGVQRRQAEFQSLVQGLGLGASSHIGEVECRFDYRICGDQQRSGEPTSRVLGLSSLSGGEVLQGASDPAAPPGHGEGI